MIGQIYGEMCRWIEEDRCRREGNPYRSSRSIFENHPIFFNIMGYISALRSKIFDLIPLWSLSFDSSFGTVVVLSTS